MAPLPRFEVRQNRVTRQWRFRLRAPNGEVVLASETYKRKAGALNAIAAIKRSAKDAPITEP